METSNDAVQFSSGSSDSMHADCKHAQQSHELIHPASFDRRRPANIRQRLGDRFAVSVGG